MRVLILNSFPLVDNSCYKKKFLAELHHRTERITEVAMVYSHTRLTDYYTQAVTRVGKKESIVRFVNNKKTEHDSTVLGTKEIVGGNLSVGRFVRSLGYAVRKYPRFNSAPCLSFVAEFAPDLIFNLSGMYIPREIISSSTYGVMSGHYGLLPDIRGGETPRWTILLNKPMVVSHMFLSPELDMGDIISRTAVDVRRGDTIFDIRKKCQLANVRGALGAFDRIIDGTLERTLQKKEEGTMFYSMGEKLRTKVDRILKQQQYDHYSD